MLIIVGITVFFGYHAAKLQIFTNYVDILPQVNAHPYMKAYTELSRMLGGANVLLITVTARKGTIFDPVLLDKVRRIGDELEVLPGVDVYKIISIARRKVKNVETSAWGIINKPVMWPEVPRTKEEMEALKTVISSSDLLNGVLVSVDSTSALIFADFFEKGINYNDIFKSLKKMQEREEDEAAIVRIGGFPMLLGYVGYFLKDVLMIFGITLGAVCLLLALIFRSVRGVVLPILGAGICAIWGLGFTRILGYNLDPLTLVLPFLISAMAISHSIQAISRFYSEYTTAGSKEACIKVIETMLMPGIVSIVTDAAGVIAIALVPITLLQKIGLACFAWSICTIVVGFLLVPILLSYFPVPKRIKDQVEARGGVFGAVLSAFNRLSLGWPKAVVAVSCIVVLAGLYFTTKMQVGDIYGGGSSLLWPNSRYNQDIRGIGQYFYGTVFPFYIFIEGKEKGFLPQEPVMKDIEKLQRFLVENSEGAVTGTVSAVDFVKTLSKKFREDDPKWEVLPPTTKDIYGTLSMLVLSADSGDYDRYFTVHQNIGNIIVYCRNRTNPVVQKVGSVAQRFIENSPYKDNYRLAGGLIGVEKATNDVVLNSQVLMLVLTFIFVYICCYIGFRSFIMAGVMLVPLVISNAVLFAYMYLAGVEVDISTLPVASVGIGFGVDYGVYLYARMLDMRKNGLGSLEEIIREAMLTTGRAVIVVVITLALGVAFWLLSKLMFQAKLGYLLAFILGLNGLSALIVIPAIVYLVKPKQLVRA
jgi:hypothetical protein